MGEDHGLPVSPLGPQLKAVRGHPYPLPVPFRTAPPAHHLHPCLGSSEVLTGSRPFRLRWALILPYFLETGELF